jgi:hypothetical protein
MRMSKVSAAVRVCLRRGAGLHRAAAVSVAALGFGAAVAVAPVALATPDPASVQASVTALTAKVKDLEASIETCGSESAQLMAIGPLDGRYRDRVVDLQDYFSEYALIKYRVMIEIEYFIELCGVVPQLEPVPKAIFESLRSIYRNFSLEDAKKVKATERITNHDVKVRLACRSMPLVQRQSD